MTKTCNKCEHWILQSKNEFCNLLLKLGYGELDCHIDGKQRACNKFIDREGKRVMEKSW